LKLIEAYSPKFALNYRKPLTPISVRLDLTGCYHTNENNAGSINHQKDPEKNQRLGFATQRSDLVSEPDDGPITAEKLGVNPV
jgi:hypothetical protein